jgi:hypothetical protein
MDLDKYKGGFYNESTYSYHPISNQNLICVGANPTDAEFQSQTQNTINSLNEINNTNIPVPVFPSANQPAHAQMLAGYYIIIESINNAINAPVINDLVDADIPAGATTAAMQAGLIKLCKQINKFWLRYCCVLLFSLGKGKTFNPKPGNNF